MLECFAKKTSKGTELATIAVAVVKKTKCQRPSEDSKDEEDEPTEPVSKRPKKVAAVTQIVSEPSPETSTSIWEVDTSDLSDLNYGCLLRYAEASKKRKMYPNTREFQLPELNALKTKKTENNLKSQNLIKKNPR
jgi:hypothetical protein